jgi:hypothetical protein
MIDKKIMKVRAVILNAAPYAAVCKVLRKWVGSLIFMQASPLGVYKSCLPGGSSSE